MSAVDGFLSKAMDNFTSGDSMHAQASAIKSISREDAQQMSPQLFQETLRKKHILVADHNLPPIPCDRRGLASLNSMKELVNIEGTC